MNFARANGLGKWGEKQVIAHLISSGLKITDVSEDEAWQVQGVDIIVNEPIYGGMFKVWHADIKLDRMISRTGNLFIETLSGRNILGNMITSSADYFLYLDPKNCILYKVDRKKIFDYWQENQQTIEVKRVTNSTKRVTEGFLITTAHIQELDIATAEHIYVEGAINAAPRKELEALPF